MKKMMPGLLVIVFTLTTYSLRAQWLIYNADVHPFQTEGVMAPLLDISEPSENSPSSTLIDSVITDPAIVGNKIFKYFHLDADGKQMYRHNFASEAVGKRMTMVARVRGSGVRGIDARAIDLQWRGAEFRDELRIWPEDSILELEKAGVEVKVDMNLNEWHIYRMEIMNDSVAVFVDENPEYVIAGTSTSTTSSRYIKFGDGSSDPTAGYLDWFIFANDTAATPGELELPAELTGLGGDIMRDWSYYTADVLPPDNNPAFTESNVDGDPAVNEIEADPDDAGNHLLKLLSEGADPSKFMWKLADGWDVDPAEHVTVIMRVKGYSETLDRSMELDLHASGLRERLYLKTDNTFELKETKIKGDMPDMLNWHTIRMTLANGEVKVYMDENMVPFAEGTSSTSTSSSYLRFGDGNGSSTLGGYVDYLVWSTDGAFSPDSVPVPLDLKVDAYVPYDRSLSMLSPDVGSLAPAFDPAETSYTLEVPGGTTAVTFTATPADPMAAVAGDLVFDGIPGTATITVTAQDGTARSYTIDVNVMANNDASLSGLTVDVGTLDPPFSPGNTSYSLEVPQGTGSINVTATPTDANATVTGDGEFTNIPGKDTIAVTAEDGITSMEYIIDVSLAVGTDRIPVDMVHLYPNPAQGYIMVSLNDMYSGSEMVITDAAGRIIRSETYRSGRQRIDISHLSEGMYMLRIEHGNKFASTTFVKK